MEHNGNIRGAADFETWVADEGAGRMAAGSRETHASRCTIESIGALVPVRGRRNSGLFRSGLWLCGESKRCSDVLNIGVSSTILALSSVCFDA